MTVISWMLNIIGFLLILAGLVMYIMEKSKKQPVVKTRGASIDDIVKLFESFSKFNTNIQLIILGMACIVLANSDLLAFFK